VSDHEFMTFVTVLIVGIAIFVAAAKEFVARAGPLAFAIVMVLSICILGAWAMPDGEFEELLSNIWMPVVSDIQHFLDAIQRERHPGNRSARPGSATQEQNRQGQPDR
jgi:hypothetical protein